MGTDKETLSELLGRGRAKLGMHDGDIDEGELEIGQVSSIINKISNVKDIISEIITDYKQALYNLNNKF
jgi:enoyl-[acyl-carrier protein] reductase II